MNTPSGKTINLAPNVRVRTKPGVRPQVEGVISHRPEINGQKIMDEWHINTDEKNPNFDRNRDPWEARYISFDIAEKDLEPVFRDWRGREIKVGTRIHYFGQRHYTGLVTDLYTAGYYPDQRQEQKITFNIDEQSSVGYADSIRIKKRSIELEKVTVIG